MITIKKSETTTTKIKNITCTDGQFVDVETGETVDLAKILESVYDGEPFDMSITMKTEKDVDPVEE